jgi:hypothetical protein
VLFFRLLSISGVVLRDEDLQAASEDSLTCSCVAGGIGGDMVNPNKWITGSTKA